MSLRITICRHCCSIKEKVKNQCKNISNIEIPKPLKYSTHTVLVQYADAPKQNSSQCVSTIKLLLMLNSMKNPSTFAISEYLILV